MAASLTVLTAPIPAIGNFIDVHGHSLFKKKISLIFPVHAGFHPCPLASTHLTLCQPTHHVAFPMMLSQKRVAVVTATPSNTAASSSPSPSEQPAVVCIPCISNDDAGEARLLSVCAPDVAGMLKLVRLDNTVTHHFSSTG